MTGEPAEAGGFRRIMRGMEEAAKIAACAHKGALPFGRGQWVCPDCRARFNQQPGREAV